MLQEYWASTVIFIEIFAQCTIQRKKNAIDFYIHVSNCFYIEIKYFSFAIDTRK